MITKVRFHRAVQLPGSAKMVDSIEPKDCRIDDSLDQYGVTLRNADDDRAVLVPWNNVAFLMSERDERSHDVVMAAAQIDRDEQLARAAATEATDAPKAKPKKK